jgi:hypothetical protein
MEDSGPYAAASRVALVVPRPANLIPSFHDDEVTTISLADHINGSCHTRDTSPNNQNVGSICVSAIVERRDGTWIGHLGSRNGNRGWASFYLQLMQGTIGSADGIIKVVQENYRACESRKA